MFPFDPSSLPQIKSRRAFIGVDFQRAFTDAGALPVTDPAGYVDRATELAAAIRETNGDVIWVRSNFDRPRQVEEERVVASDHVSPPSSDSVSEAEDQQTPVKDPGPAEAGLLPDREAFLSHGTADFLADGGLDWASQVEDKIVKSDVTLTKTSYSAFKGTRLLDMLRAKMVMEVFICGSLTNIGVHATAIDAACHGLGITIVDDCCGYISKDRQQRAIQSIIEFTGCEIASLKEALVLVKPPPPKKHGKKAKTKKSPDLVQPMAALKLATDSIEPSEQLARLSLNSSDDTGGSVGGPVPAAAAAASDKASNAAAVTTATLLALSDANSELPREDQSVPSIIAESTPQVQEQPAFCAPDPGQEEGLAVVADSGSRRTVTTPEAPPSPSVKGSSGLNGVHDDEGDEATPGAKLCQGDTSVITDLLPKDLEDGVFDILRTEVKWQRMSHQGGDVPRLVAVQGQVAEDGSIPVYRHPADESPPLLPFSPTVLAIKRATEKHLGHPLNHVLIQYYRDGNDYISEHSDKTLDIVRGSFIANVSLGAERTMVLRTKRLDRDPSRPATTTSSVEPEKRKVCRANLPHNSLLRMGLHTNQKWLHSIRQDKRAQRDKAPAELAFDSGRISLTFRHIATFLSSDETLIWGQGASSKIRDKASSVKNGQCSEAVEMLKAFGIENRSSNFDWELQYGKGFDVLHMSTSARFFASEDPLANMQVTLMLAEFGISYAKGSMGPAKQGQAPDYEALPIKFVDSTEGRPTVQGDVPIFLYLDAVYGTTDKSRQDQGHAVLAKRYTRFHQAMSLSRKLQRETSRLAGKLDSGVFERELTVWNHYGAEANGNFLAGSEPSLPDFVIWPVLHTLVQEGSLDVLGPHRHLKLFYERFGTRESVRKIGVEFAGTARESA